MSDIYSKLSADHRQASDLLQELADTGAVDRDRRAALFPTLKQALLLHSKAEEATFYDALRRDGELRDEIRHAGEEHQEMDSLLEQLEGMDMATAQWGERIMTLQSTVEHHIREEEGKIFRHAKEVLSDTQARELGRAFDAEKARLSAAA